MDVDWCLSCERKLHLPSGPYCSPECLSDAQPAPSSPSLLLPFPVPESGTHRIRQWARAIPPHIPAGAPALPFEDLPLLSPDLPPSERLPSRRQPTPKLIERTAACTPLPTLGISSPATLVRPPHPARAQSYSQPNPTTCMSEASTSLSSLLSEPMVATPDEDASFGANIGALVRCWVGRDRANSTKSSIQDCVIEKVTDYFPALPHPKKPSSPLSYSRKSKNTPPPSPPPASRHKQSPKKLAVSPDRDHSTPSLSRPTPVVFPSCRAWVDDDDDCDESFVAPKPQYHPAYYEYEPQRQVEAVHRTRAPSLSSSSSDSSVLLMAPKRGGAVRGRKGMRAVAA